MKNRGRLSSNRIDVEISSIEGGASLDEIVCPRATRQHYVQINSNSLNKFGIANGDWLVANLDVAPYDGCLVILHGDCIQEYQRPRNRLHVVGTEKESDAEIWGVITHVLHKL